MHNKKSILIFPANAASATTYSRIAAELGFNVVEASSEVNADLIGGNNNIRHLPYVSEASFNQAFEDLLEQEGIEKVYSPHPAVWNHLSALSRNSSFSVQFEVCNPPPLLIEWDSFKQAYDFGRKCVEHNNSIVADGKVLSSHHYANLYRGYHNIPGQCDDAKLMLLTRIARQIPKGDIVEIGSLYGRSAFALAWLSEHHDLGPVICVDPWKTENISNQGKDAQLLNSMADVYNWDRIFQAFVVSLAGSRNVNYLREPSASASDQYLTAATTAGRITSNELGITEVLGRISMLHVDGNHRYEEVKRDVELWLPMVVEGGWLLLDDYVWAFGDGPKRVGDELLGTGRIKQSILFGDTLCLQL
ncbi:MAG: class I SAM-dependent methyltransferase [Candidimonas sp.]|nr:class I SAM-dependent methyltransferase [Candidimonas sp.]